MMDKRFYKTKERNAALRKVQIQTFEIAKRIEPRLKQTITEGLPAIYTFRAFPPYRSPEAKELRIKVAKILKKERLQR